MTLMHASRAAARSPSGARAMPGAARTSAPGVGRVLLALCVSALAAGCSRRAPEEYNLVLVTLDTTRADYLSCYGGPAGITPNLDAVAAEGTRFDLAISSAAVTPVSHASILTGLYPMEHGLRVLSAAGGFRLPSKVPTLSTVLHGNGYATAAVHSAFPVSAHFGFKPGYDVFESFDAPIEVGTDKHFWDVRQFQRRSDETTDIVIRKLAEAPVPFFLWVHYWDPHDSEKIPPPEFLPADLPRTPPTPELPHGEIAASKELYAAEVRFVDAQFGRLVKSLKDEGEWDHTIVVIVADHGEGLGDHGWHHHRILYQEEIRVPLIVRVPGAKQVKSVAGLVRTIDILPTVLDYLGLEAPRPVSGESLRALMDGGPDEKRKAYADQINGYDMNAAMVKNRPLDDFLYCAMDAEWKLIYRPAHPEATELYHIAVDPHETKNVLAQAPEAARRLERELAQYNGWVTAPLAPIADPGNLAGAKAVLGRIGYIGSEDAAALPASEWAWTCPEHAGEVREKRFTCSQCKSAPILIRKPK